MQKAFGQVTWKNHWEREMFYLTTHSTHFIYGYMASDIWLRTIQIAREETRCHHMCYSFWLTARVILYAPSHRQDNTYHGFCYTSRGALAGTRNSSMGPPNEGSIWRPTAPWVNALPLSYVQLPKCNEAICCWEKGRVKRTSSRDRPQVQRTLLTLGLPSEKLYF